ncbi:MAG: deoxynucleoside kinase [Phycisphaerae bacterium]|jgi:deoxyadenosine/deoxycytidine kinase|nr:deoxynucleoside kinase [Phycisphaerae bacterium]MDP7637393.1 deoxynucleoside kinase [Phycisphaerae bacterium]
MSAKLISIIGPPAVGKTTLACCLANEMPATLIREDYQGNPFLVESYLGSAEACLPAQMHFLMSRVGQLALAAWPDEGLVVSDYGFCQDRIYAAAKLSADELRLYERLARRVEGLVYDPDVIVHLDAPESVLLERISVRGRKHEKVMTSRFLQVMRIAYNEIDQTGNCAVIHVECTATDFCDPHRRRELIAQIRALL